MTLRFDVTGMMCASCAAAVERAAKKCPAVTQASVNLQANSLTVEAADASAEKEIVRLVKKAGYGAAVHTGVRVDARQRDAERRKVLRRLLISAVLLVPLMTLSMGPMLGLPLPAALTGASGGVLQGVLALAVMVVDRKFFVSGAKAVFSGSPNMDTLVSLGSGASFLYSAAVCAARFAGGEGHLYFESAAMILTLVTVGKYLEERARVRSGAAVESLLTLAPPTALVLRDGRETVVAASDLAVGDRIVVRTGDRLPADGVLESGALSLDEASLTGESMPRETLPGDRLLCASVCTGGGGVMTASAVGDDTTLAKMIDLVDNAGASKARSARLADRAAGVFVPVVSGLALLTFALWLFIGRDLPSAVTHGVSVLVVSCPCALGLATPVAITAAVGACAANGVLLKSAETVEETALITNVVLDKTGTVTEGRPAITDVLSDDPDGLLTVAASLERGSSHPLAKAVLDRAEGLPDGGLPEAFASIPGKGVSAVVGGKHALGGSRALLEENGVDCSRYAEDEKRLTAEGRTLLYFAADGRLLGLLAASDGLRPGAAEAAAKLHELGCTVTLLSGDNAETASRIAAAVGTDACRAPVLPDGKAAVVAGLPHCMMVGDGVNDSPALALAAVGVAVGGGADIASEAADAVLMRPDLTLLPDLIGYARFVTRVIRQNLFWAFFYNLLAIPVAAGALSFCGVTLSPMLASACMSCSSLFVVTNALRLTKWGKRDRR